jgi:hypothetical protein
MSYGTKKKTKAARKKPAPAFRFYGKRSTRMMLEIAPWAREQYMTN